MTAALSLLDTASIEQVSRLESVLSTRRQLPAGDGNVTAAASAILALARTALTDREGSCVAEIQLTTATDVQAAEALVLNRTGSVRTENGRWVYRLCQEVER